MKNEYAAIDQYKSVAGLVSICMGFAVILGYILLFVLAYMAEGEAGPWIGTMGFLLLFVAIAAIIVAIKGLRNPDAQNARPILALVLNGVILAGIVALYAWGASK